MTIDYGFNNRVPWVTINSNCLDHLDIDWGELIWIAWAKGPGGRLWIEIVGAIELDAFWFIGIKDYNRQSIAMKYL